MERSSQRARPSQQKINTPGSITKTYTRPASAKKKKKNKKKKHGPGRAFPRKSGCGVGRLQIFRQSCALASSVNAFSFKIALSRGASLYLRAESRFGVKRPRPEAAQFFRLLARSRAFLFNNVLSQRRCMFAENRVLVWSVFTIQRELRSRVERSSQRARPPQKKKRKQLPCGTSSDFQAEARSGVKRPRIFTQNCVLAWSVFEFSRRIALWCEASSEFRAESRCGMERPCIFVQKCALSWSIVVFLHKLASGVELPHNFS